MEKKCVFCGSVIAEGAKTWDAMTGVCCSKVCKDKRMAVEGEAAIFAVSELNRLAQNDDDPDKLYGLVEERYGKEIADAMLNGKRNKRVGKRVIKVMITGKKVTIKGYSNGTIVLNGREEVEAMKETIEGILQSMGGNVEDD